MTAPASIKDLEGPTGRSWEQWLEFFEKNRFSSLPHADIARRLAEAGVPAWWSQALTVAYEQHLGRRVPGQTQGGTFNVSASRTMDGPRGAVLERWDKRMTGKKRIGGALVEGPPATSLTPNRSYWRARLEGNLKLQVAFEQTGGTRTAVNISIEGIETQQAADIWRATCKELLAGFT